MKRTFSWTLVIVSSLTLTTIALLGPNRLWGQGVGAQSEGAEDTSSFEFALIVEGETLGYFQTCTGLVSASDVYEEAVLVNASVQRMQRRPGSKLLWEDITLTRSAGASDETLWEWRKDIEDSDLDTGLRDGQIVLFGPSGETAYWTFTNGWPVRLSVDESVETVTIAHDGISRSGGSPTRSR